MIKVNIAYICIHCTCKYPNTGARQERRWLKSYMMTSSNENIFRGTGTLCGKFTGHWRIPTQRPVTRSFDVFFDLRLNKRLSKQ